MPEVSVLAIEAVCTGLVDHAYEYAVCPPETETFTEPVLPPKQLIWVATLALAVGKGYTVIFTVSDEAAPVQSVMQPTRASRLYQVETVSASGL